MASGMEVEIKLAVESAQKTRALLRQHGFAVSVRRVFERNLILDDPAQSLRSKQALLRLREAGKTVTCTFKGPDQPGRHKQREEREFHATDFEACLAVFAGLGYTERFRYEKYRTEFRREAKGVATIDETPIGIFMELEGPARWIDRTARDLGFSSDDYITLSYGKLYAEWCREHGTTPSNLTFPARSRPA